jgi:hypothetical protein
MKNWTFEELIEVASKEGIDYEIVTSYNEMLEEGYSSEQAATETAKQWSLNDA